MADRIPTGVTNYKLEIARLLSSGQQTKKMETDPWRIAPNPSRLRHCPPTRTSVIPTHSGAAALAAPDDRLGCSREPAADRAASPA